MCHPPDFYLTPSPPLAFFHSPLFGEVEEQKKSSFPLCSCPAHHHNAGGGGVLAAVPTGSYGAGEKERDGGRGIWVEWYFALE